MTIIEIIGLCFALILLLFMISGGTWAAIKDRKDWNKGVCNSCYAGVWKSYACDSGGNAAYKCTNCSASWWESGYGTKIELDPNNSEEIIRSIKLKKLKKRLG